MATSQIRCSWSAIRENENKMDFAVLQASYTQFFRNKEQPNKPAPAGAVHVAGIGITVWSAACIEVIAVKASIRKRKPIFVFQGG